MNSQIIKRLKKEVKWSTDDETLVAGGSGSSEDEEAEMRKNEAMKKVFKIPDILEEIIEDVEDLNDLKECRLVNSMWMETTTKLMLKKNSAFVALKLDSRTLTYQKFSNWHKDRYFRPGSRSYYVEDEEGVEDADGLTDFKEIVDKSTKFPCSTFVIYRRNLRDLVMKDVFKVVGDSIKHLKLIQVGREFTEVGKLLRFNFPNLETLYIEGGPIGEDQILWNPEKISVELPKLKMLDIQIYQFGERLKSPFQMLENLVAPNLQVIRGFDLTRDWEAVANAGKIHCVKELNLFVVGMPEDPTRLEILIQVGPQLESLYLCHWLSLNSLDPDLKSNWLRLIQNLLDFNKTTLKTFNFRGIENVFENLTSPKFPQLREIQLNLCTAEEGVRCPYEILSDEICPNLQVIHGFDMSRDVQGVATAGKIHFVKELSLTLYRHELKLLNLFLSGRPQLEILILHVGLTDLNLKTELTDFLEKLLELSKDTLRGFKFNGVGDVFEDMTFPKFSKLEYFEVEAGPSRIFPRGINLTETFPKLKILDFHICSYFDKDENWDRYFPPPNAFTGSLTSVKTLIFHEGFTDSAKRNFRMMCPNAKGFYIKYT